MLVLEFTKSVVSRLCSLEMDYVPVIPAFESVEKYVELEALSKHFKGRYGSPPNFYVRVPGRVNLIGEHIDYCGYSVLPMAIEQDIVLAVSVNNDEILNLSNVDSVYEDFSTTTSTLKIDQSCPKWYHYFICGFKGITDDSLLTPKGLDVLVKGTIPPSAGLSSSSALVCAAALATARANRVSLTKMGFASLCAKSERYIGTEGGGMDQAIAFLAEPGCSKLIDFNPLKATSVPLPPGATFVVANSCVEMNKAASATFNIRVVECKLSAKILAKALNLDWEKIEKLADIPKKLNMSCLEEMSSLVKKFLHPEPYTAGEICNILEVTENDLLMKYLTKNTSHVKVFKLHQRSLHVYEEADRVSQFKIICDQQGKDALEKLGTLMNESHASCRDLYECSHADLDNLVNIALEAGALGSRLTGAGWGGCCVSLVMNNILERFLKEVEEKFYNKMPERKNRLKIAMFPTKPGGGAVIYTA